MNEINNLKSQHLPNKVKQMENMTVDFILKFWDSFVEL